MAKKNRQEALEELNAIAEAHDGVLRPADVVEYARDEDTVLHKYFEWDDTKAAEQYRFYQARNLIRWQVTFLQHEDQGHKVRAFYSLSEDRGADSYRRTEDILSDEDRRAQLVTMALRELSALQAKYAHLSELANVFNAVDQAMAEHTPPTPAEATETSTEAHP